MSEELQRQAEAAQQEPAAIVERLSTFRPVWLQFGVTMHRDVSPNEAGWLRRQDVLDALGACAQHTPEGLGRYETTGVREPAVFRTTRGSLGATQPADATEAPIDVPDKDLAGIWRHLASTAAEGPFKNLCLASAEALAAPAASGMTDAAIDALIVAWRQEHDGEGTLTQLVRAAIRAAKKEGGAV